MSDPNESIRDFFRDPSVAKAVIDLVVHKKPVGWSRRSNAPYYKREYALEMKNMIDEMLKTREDQVFMYRDFPRLASSSLYLKVNQALRYLVEKMDTEDKLYARWYEMVHISQERGVGVRISFIEELRTSAVSSFKPRAISSAANTPQWKQQVDEYLESDEVKPLHIDKLCLTQDDVKATRESLQSVKGIMFTVFAHEIKIIKTR